MSSLILQKPCHDTQPNGILSPKGSTKKPFFSFPCQNFGYLKSASENIE